MHGMPENESGAGVTGSERTASTTWWQIWWPFQIVCYGLHVAAVYLVAEFLAGRLSALVRNWLLPAINQTSSYSRMEFAMNYLPWWCLVSGGLSGLALARYRPKLARFAWAIPAAILAWKLIAYHPPGGSVLGSGSGPGAFAYYFGTGFNLPDYHNYRELFERLAGNPDAFRMMAQMNYTAPFYTGVAYSLAGLAAKHVKIPTMKQLRRRDEE